MKIVRYFLVCILLLFLAACLPLPDIVIQTPVQFNPTPVIVLSTNPISTTTAGLTGKTVTPTRTSTPAVTLTTTPAATALPEVVFNVFIQTCDTGVDIFHDMGEVTNAYVTLQNLGNVPANDVIVTLSASDEDRTHPDKSYAVNALPAGYEINLKLTVDSRDGEDTRLMAVVKTAAGMTESAYKDGCDARQPDETVIARMGELFVVRKVE